MSPQGRCTSDFAGMENFQETRQPKVFEILLCFDRYNKSWRKMSTSRGLLIHPCLQSYSDWLSGQNTVMKYLQCREFFFSREAILSSEKDFPAIKQYNPLHFNIISMHVQNNAATLSDDVHLLTSELTGTQQVQQSNKPTSYCAGH